MFQRQVPNGSGHPIRSFVTRRGRTTAAQQRALSELWTRWGVDDEEVLTLEQLFASDRALAAADRSQIEAPRMEGPTIEAPEIEELARPEKLFLEIGFGMGDALAELASRNPAYGFLGIEVHEPGIGTLLSKCRDLPLHNVRICRGDALEVMRERVLPASLDGIYVLFPDPWPKKRHHKRRLIQPEPVALLADRLKPGATLELATDWAPYAEQMLEVLGAQGSLQNCAENGGFSPRPITRPLTKFEKRGQRLGHAIFDLVFRKRCDS